MNKYETVFILTPVLSDDQMKETVEKFKKVLTDNGGNIENEENWGLRKLAYPIENKNTGFYTLIEFEGEATIVDKLETAFRRDEKVIRFLTFRLDKYAAEYAIKRRAVRKAKLEERAAQEAEAAAAPVVEDAPVEAPAAEETPAAEA
jgi:small subunit ribosomal protein S6